MNIHQSLARVYTCQIAIVKRKKNTFLKILLSKIIYRLVKSRFNFNANPYDIRLECMCKANNHTIRERDYVLGHCTLCIVWSSIFLTVFCCCWISLSINGIDPMFFFSSLGNCSYQINNCTVVLVYQSGTCKMFTTLMPRGWEWKASEKKNN